MPPTILTIFGITGDLARRKLLPALLDLESAGILQDNLRIIGFSRRELSGDEFKNLAVNTVANRVRKHSPDIIEKFLERLIYCQGLFNQPSGYARLGEVIYALEKGELGQCANKLYYLATPPTYYEDIFRELAHSGLTIPCAGVHKWARICVEKPFGRDIDTAESLDRLLGKLFKEEQIFRIDHYLAKEAVQNIIMFRFSNALFEPLWSGKHIERVEIRMHESRGLEGREEFFESVGALRDVGQNHLLQMLAIVAMENPEIMDAAHIRSSRARVLKNIVLARPFVNSVARGQYIGYRDRAAVNKNSQNETYFRLEVRVKNSRWRAVPFILEAGKALPQDLAEISVYFKAPERCLVCLDKSCEHRNVLIFRIQPDEGIKLRFWIKSPGLQTTLIAKELSFFYKSHPAGRELPDAYERLLYDALIGDQTLFASTDEVRAAWKFITPILEKWRKVPLIEYDKGMIPDLGSNN
jgi:glucose-6-phosphate 1-dehydrogenase